MTARKTIIVDIDGTLSDSRHRLHHMEQKPKNRDAFHAAFPQDQPIKAVVAIVNALADDYSIVLLTGRPDRYRDGTQDQMDGFGVIYDELHMRPAGDTQGNASYKFGVLQQLRARGHDVFLAIDDRPDIVNMWRSNGIHCLDT
jgi:phosphoglycolate phosphatase-like HAD superfamily hydrolase